MSCVHVWTCSAPKNGIVSGMCQRCGHEESWPAAGGDRHEEYRRLNVSVKKHEDRKDEIIELAKSSTSLYAVAKELGIPLGSLHAKLTQWGLKPAAPAARRAAAETKRVGRMRKQAMGQVKEKLYDVPPPPVPAIFGAIDAAFAVYDTYAEMIAWWSGYKNRREID